MGAAVLVVAFAIYYVMSGSSKISTNNASSSTSIDVVGLEGTNTESATIERVEAPAGGTAGVDVGELKVTLAMDAAAKAELLSNYNIIRDALKRDATSPEWWLRLGAYRMTAGDFAGAVAAWEEVIRLSPGSPKGYNSLGEFYTYTQLNAVKAESNFLKSLSLAPQVAVYRSLHELYRYSYPTKVDQADDVLLQGLVKMPKNPDLLALLAGYYAETGNKQEAITYYTELVAVDPNNTAATAELAELKK